MNFITKQKLIFWGVAVLFFGIVGIAELKFLSIESLPSGYRGGYKTIISNGPYGTVVRGVLEDGSLQPLPEKNNQPYNVIFQRRGVLFTLANVYYLIPQGELDTIPTKPCISRERTSPHPISGQSCSDLLAIPGVQKTTIINWPWVFFEVLVLLVVPIVVLCWVWRSHIHAHSRH